MAEGRFRIVEGGQSAKPKRARNRAPWECRVCEAAIGVRSRSLVQVRDGAFEDSRGRLTGGRKVWVCATCLSRGLLTRVTS